MRLFKSRKSIENISSPSSNSFQPFSSEITVKNKSSSSSPTSSTTCCSTMEGIAGVRPTLQQLSSSSLPDLHDSPAKLLRCLNQPTTTTNLQASVVGKEIDIERASKLFTNNCKQNISSTSNNTNLNLNEFQLSSEKSGVGRRSLQVINSDASLYDKKQTSSAIEASPGVDNCSNIYSYVNSAFIPQCTNNNSNRSAGTPISGNKNSNNGNKNKTYVKAFAIRQHFAT